MTVREALARGAFELSGTGSETPFLDSTLLLARAVACPRDALLARAVEELSPEAESAYRDLLMQRGRGRSMAYILGEKEFYGRIFRVDARVLVPRPETEILVETALGAARGCRARPGLRVHDAFTGSGCVGITLAAELPDAKVTLSDLSPAALEIAGLNARILLGRDLDVLESDVLASVDGLFDLITANPPYIAAEEVDRLFGPAIPGQDGIREPNMALDGGPDGLCWYRRLVPDAEKRLVPGGVLAVEIGEEQSAAVAALFHVGGFRDVRVVPDLAGRDRVVVGMLE